MALDELLGLHEHATRPAAGVVDLALVRCEHFDQHLDHRGRGVELPALLALGAGELAEEILVHLAQDVFGLGARAEADGGDQVHQLAHLARLQLGAAVALVQDALEARVVGLDGVECLVDADADVPELGLGAQGLPARDLGHPEHISHGVVIALLQRGGLVGRIGQVQVGRGVVELGFELLAALVECVRDVFDEDEPKHDVLVLGGVHAGAQLVGGGPERFLEVLVHAGYRRLVLVLVLPYSASACAMSARLAYNLIGIPVYGQWQRCNWRKCDQAYRVL